jgi:hypothetical protein
MSRLEGARREMAYPPAQKNTAVNVAFRLRWQPTASRSAPLVLRPAPKRRGCKTCDGVGCIGRCRF